MAKILIVDRDKRVRLYYERELGRQRHRVTAVPSIHEGLQIFQVWKPDLIVLDIEIPDPPEVQAIKSVLSLNRYTPVLFTSALSGYGRPRSRTGEGTWADLQADLVCMQRTIRDLLRPLRADPLGLRRRRRVASVSAPRPDGFRPHGRHSQAAARAAQATRRGALA